MMDCLIIGDSIAVGLSTYRKECITIAKGGFNTKQWNVAYMNRPAFDMQEYNTAIISLGTNDHQYVETEENLNEIRETVKAKTVFWIMPANNLKASNVPIEKIQKIILKLARNNGDKIVYIKDLSPDKIHPSNEGYKWLAYDTKVGQ
jgi:hypothetical protein